MRDRGTGGSEVAARLRAEMGRRPRPRRLGAAGALGLAGLLSAATLVWAGDEAGIFETLRFDATRLWREAPPAPPARFAAPVERPRAAPRAPSRTVQAPARPVAAAAFTPGFTPITRARGQSVCVRLCDGYFFPVGDLGGSSDLSLHRDACAAACPGAPTELFTLAAGAEGIEGARSAGSGRAYTALPAAFAHRSRPVAACSCTGPSRVAALLAPQDDRTLRRGDVVVGALSAQAFEGPRGSRRAFRDFRRSASLGAAERRRVDALLGVSAREATRAAFLRGKTVIREARLPGPLVEAGPVGAAAPTTLAGGFTLVETTGSFRDVRTVVPSPFRGVN